MAMSDTAGSPVPHARILFWASFFTLIAAGMGFSIRGDIIDNWGTEYGFTQSEKGEINGLGLAGFGITIIVFSFLGDAVGFGKVMLVAFLLHVSSVIATLAAPFAYAKYGKEGAMYCLTIGQVLFSLANGTCEAVINPLTATLFPKNKTHWLNILHAGWPGGLVLGAVVGLIANSVGNIGWQIRYGIILLPMFLYGFMMFNRLFPKSEASASGLSVMTMFTSIFTPILLFLFLIHAMVGYVELGTDGWIQDITKVVLANKDYALYAFIWTNVLMFALRFFAGPIVHKISPLGLLFVSAVLGAGGLYMLGMSFTNSIWPWLGAVTIYAVGKTFYWPTMLGVISERYPKGGSIALGIAGGIGMLSAVLLGSPLIGYKQDLAATQKLQSIGKETDERYRVEKPQPALPSIAVVKVPENVFPNTLVPLVAGLDNSKVGVLTDYMAIQEKKKANPNLTADEQKLAIEKDLDLLAKEPDDNKTKTELKARLKWWNEIAQPQAETDAPKIGEAKLYGGKKALEWTATVPAVMAICYLLLIIYFKAIGGYKQLHVNEQH